MPITFDGPNLKIILPSVGDYLIDKDFYSDWKEWVLISDNSKYPPAFETTGGDPISATSKIAPYFFIRNDLGWRVQAPEQSGEINLDGNLFARNSDLPVFLPPSGSYTVTFRQLVSSRATVESAGGVLTDWTAQEKEQIRKVLGIIGVKSGPDGSGQIQDILSKIGKIDTRTKIQLAEEL